MQNSKFTLAMGSPMGFSRVSKYRCPGCGYTYDESLGDNHEGYPPDFAFKDLPDEFVCPDCSVRYKEDFVVGDAPAP